MNIKQIVSLAGSVIVLIGCCMPIANNLIDANVGYMFSSGAFLGGVILIAMGALGIYGAYRESSIMVLVAATIGALIFTYTLLTVSGVLGEVEDFAELSITAVSFRFGAVIITVGLLIMLGSTLMVPATSARTTAKKHRSRTTRKSNLKEDNIHRSDLTRARNLKRSSSRRTSSSSIFKSASGNKHRSSRRRSSASR